MFKLVNENCALEFVVEKFARKLIEHDLWKYIFYDGQITDPHDILNLFESIDVVFGYHDGELVGAIWIQRTEHRVGRIHLVSFPPFDMMEAKETIQDYLQIKLDRSNKSCYSIIIGITPYQRVARYFKRWGFSGLVKLPDYHYDIYKQCYVPCWQVFLTTNER